MRGARDSIDGAKLDQPDRNTLVLTGALTFGSAAHVFAEGARALAGGTQTQLDLAGVTRADSAGLACVIALAAAANRAGRHLRVTHWPEGLHALAEVSDVAALLEPAAAVA
ncbi:MAG TPA: STAS domain-containing protein [Rhodanobacteraceae bacterium]|jgi:phospholipid transport system transporter-binding protein|nr:STAS domain-containing protein [Rhodanobacteraceae bacterium]